MSLDESVDPIFRMLARLPSAAPDAASVDRTRARCHAELARGHRSPARVRPGRSSRVLNAATFAAIAVYLTEAVRLAFTLVR
jgi:hypothetical protein